VAHRQPQTCPGENHRNAPGRQFFPLFQANAADREGFKRRELCRRRPLGFFGSRLLLLPPAPTSRRRKPRSQAAIGSRAQDLVPAMAFGALVASRLARSGRTLASAVAQVRAISVPVNLLFACSSCPLVKANLWRCPFF